MLRQASAIRSRTLKIMLAISPVSLLVFLAVLVLVLQRLRRGLGYAWLAAVAGSLLVTGLVIFLHYQTHTPQVIPGWQITAAPNLVLIFGLDDFSWPYALGLCGLLGAVVLTAPARLQYRSNPFAWSGTLIVASGGMLAILAQTPIALVFAWTVVDIIEVSMILASVTEPGALRQAILAFAVRVCGSMLALWAIFIGQSGGAPVTFTAMPPQASLYLLLAAGLRVGVIPLHLPYTQEPDIRRGLGTMLRLVTPAVSLVLLGRLPPTVVPPDIAPLVLVFTSLAALFGGVAWLASGNALNGRPFWIIALAGMALSSAVRGHPEAARAWGLALLVNGGLVFLHSEGRRWLTLLPMLGVVALTGLPFTPAASGWSGLIVPPFNLLDIVLIGAHAAVVLGFIRQVWYSGTRTQLDNWMVAAYALGMSFLLITHWLSSLLDATAKGLSIVWWGALASTILVLFIWALRWYARRPGLPGAAATDWLLQMGRRFGRPLTAFFSLEWLYRFLAIIASLVEQVVRLLTQLFEGEAGVLWTMLLLVLLFTLLRPAGAP
jgi:hypothetical protein